MGNPKKDKMCEKIWQKTLIPMSQQEDECKRYLLEKVESIVATLSERKNGATVAVGRWRGTCEEGNIGFFEFSLLAE